jgi:hypothetical protein
VPGMQVFQLGQLMAGKEYRQQAEELERASCLFQNRNPVPEPQLATARWLQGQPHDLRLDAL